jgi:hypothetical protein
VIYRPIKGTKEDATCAGRGVCDLTEVRLTQLGFVVIAVDVMLAISILTPCRPDLPPHPALQLHHPSLL